MHRDLAGRPASLVLIRNRAGLQSLAHGIREAPGAHCDPATRWCRRVCVSRGSSSVQNSLLLAVGKARHVHAVPRMQTAWNVLSCIPRHTSCRPRRSLGDTPSPGSFRQLVTGVAGHRDDAVVGGMGDDLPDEPVAGLVGVNDGASNLTMADDLSHVATIQ